MSGLKIAAIIPAYNEGNRIGGVVREVDDFVDEVVVIDDNSSDYTVNILEGLDVNLVRHEENKGYLASLRSGFESTDADVFVTLDADGEMDPSFIPDLVEPIEKGEADLVLGKREKVPRVSERFLSRLASFSVDVSDTGTGYRAIRGGLAREMELRGVCPCGTFVLEADRLGGKIVEVSVENRDIDKPKGMAWKHFFQFWYVIKEILLNIKK